MKGDTAEMKAFLMKPDLVVRIISVGLSQFFMGIVERYCRVNSFDAVVIPAVVARMLRPLLYGSHACASKP